ncbi:hypothetical protein GGTG_02665 [Gaeumannomyces tritici R3-111a-1]|uniref:Mid2 domain-containing protein n=1 Tax=Gaeumannomyces tritici (strain R3-111a-1) TaxID=644352 RepID=J3NN07_GAET3|nr:hypothetical protein GGTG_02665 [Gaeumannomyces tritici R3-111a-1]EJT77559.1 hypothetical protein GGTG_02665 [Gaeumannomyces tritici R3-111a-1]
MFRCRGLAVAGLALLLSAVVAQRTVQEAVWNVPSGKAKDLSQTFQLGQLVPLSWNAYNGTVCDLWLTTWDPNDPRYEYRINENVDLRRNGNMNWRVPTLGHTIEMAKQTAKFVLRFKPPSPSGVFKSNEPELSSPGFLLIMGDLSTATSASSSTSTSSSSTLSTEAGAVATPAKTPSSTPTPTPTPTPEPPAAGISGAAIGGIAAGAIAGLAAASVLVWLFIFRARKKRAAAAAASAENATYAGAPSKEGELEGGSSAYGSPPQQHKPYEAPGDYARHEAPGDSYAGGGGYVGGHQYQSWELDGSERR